MEGILEDHVETRRKLDVPRGESDFPAEGVGLGGCDTKGEKEGEGGVRMGEEEDVGGSKERKRTSPITQG